MLFVLEHVHRGRRVVHVHFILKNVLTEYRYVYTLLNEMISLQKHVYLVMSLSISLVIVEACVKCQSQVKLSLNCSPFVIHKMNIL